MTRGGDWSAASISQGRWKSQQMPEGAGGRRHPPLQAAEGSSPPDTSALDFWPPELCTNTVLLFSVAPFVVVCYSSPRKPDTASFRVLGQMPDPGRRGYTEIGICEDGQTIRSAQQHFSITTDRMSARLERNSARWIAERIIYCSRVIARMKPWFQMQYP